MVAWTLTSLRKDPLSHLGHTDLHGEGDRCVLHRDIKASNIMLDINFNVKVGDFGLARLMDHELGSHTIALAGNYIIVKDFCLCVDMCRASEPRFIEIQIQDNPIKFDKRETKR